MVSEWKTTTREVKGRGKFDIDLLRSLAVRITGSEGCDGQWPYSL
jgi:hypothetical protein